MQSNDQQALRRRTMLAGAGTAGALAAVAAVMPGHEATPAKADAVALATSETSPGYRLTEHVKRYYQTARV